MTAKPFTLEINTENTLIRKEAKTERALELLVRAPSGKAMHKRAPLNLALVLDRSGSMHGEKLEYVRQAAAHVLDLLAEGDRAAIVAYDNQVTLVAESTPITAATRVTLKARLSDIQSGGMTNLSGGWFTGCEQVALQMADGAAGQINRALLLTDGLANEGITDLEALATHARELADRGISTSTFGVGDGYNEYLLESIAQQGRGSFYFISVPADIPQIFYQEFAELSAITARDVEIELDLPAGVGVEVLGGLRFEISGQKLRISLGSLMSEREQGVYLNLALPPYAGSEGIPFRAVARAKGQDGQMLEAGARMAFHYASDAEVMAAPRRGDVQQRAALARMAHTANLALKLEREGRVEEGAQMLEAALIELRAFLPPEQISYYHNLVQRMRHGLREADRKEAHYDAYLARSARVDPTFRKRQGEK